MNELGKQPDGSYLTPFAITVVYNPGDHIQTIAAHLIADAQLCEWPCDDMPKYITPAVCMLVQDDATLAKLTELGSMHVPFVDTLILPGFCARMLADVCGWALDQSFPTVLPVAPDAPACLRAYADVHGAVNIAAEIASERGFDTEKTSEYIARGRGIIEFTTLRAQPQSH